MNESKKVIRAWIAKDFFGLYKSGIVQNNELFLVGVADTSEQAKSYLDAWVDQKGYILGILCEFETESQILRMLEK